MNLFGHDWTFWVAIIGATIIKLVTSPYHSFWRTMTTVFVAVFCAYFFTDPVIDLLGLNPEAYRTAMAAVVTLTGEGVMRLLIAISVDPKKGFELLRAWRGGE